MARDWSKVGAVSDPVDPESDHASFLENLEGSAKNFAGNISQAILHPQDTMSGIHDVVNGYLDKLPGVHADDAGAAMRQQQMADAMTKHFKDRYGSVENIKKTAYEDPVGFAADLSSALAPVGGLVGAAGEAADVAGLARTASTLRTAAKVASTTAEVTNPLNAAKIPLKGAATVADVAGAAPETVAAIRNPVSTGAVGLAKRLYANSLNPVGATAQQVGQLAETGLKEGVGPADESKLWKRVMQHADTVKDLVDQGTQRGLTLDPDQVRTNVADKLLPDENGNYQFMGQTKTAPQPGVPGESFGVQATPEEDRAIVRGKLGEWTDEHFIPAKPGVPANPGTMVAGQNTPNPTYVGGTPAIPATPEQPIPIPIAKGNDIKSGTYQQLSKKAFGKSAAGATQPVAVASEQAQLEIARDLRRQIGDQLSGAGIGDVHGANAAEGRLLDLRPYVEKNAANAARSGLLDKATKGALINKALPGVAMGLYKAGKMDLPTLQYILRQSATGIGQENAQ